MRTEFAMIASLACLYGRDIATNDKEFLAFYFQAAEGAKAAVKSGVSKSATKASIRMTERYLRGTTLQVVKRGFKYVGVNFTRKGVTKALPVGVGGAVGLGANYLFTRQLGYEAKKYFEINSGPWRSEFNRG